MYIFLSIIGIIIVILILIYNRIVSLNVRCNNAWASIDNQLKRRADLIPNLVEVTKGYAKYESETLEQVVSLRSESITDKAIQSEKVSNALNKLLALTENYPELKADKLFQNLQIELVGTEDKIAYARQFYNDTVQRYNEKLYVFPNNIVVSLFGKAKFEEAKFFEITDEAQKEAVKVQF